MMSKYFGSHNLQESRVKIFLDSVEVPLKLGIYPHEKSSPQRVVIGVEVYAEPLSYLKTVDTGTIIDYGILYKEVCSWAERPHTQLIEDYLKELIDLCFRFDAVTACRASIRKADIFGPEQGAGVEAFIQREDWEF